MVNEGDTIKLPCQVDVLDGIIIIWKKGSKILALGEKMQDMEDTRIKVVPMKNGNKLVISLADFATDDGEFTCQLSALKTLELVHTVRVRVQPEVEAVPASGSLVVRAGAPAHLGCRVRRGSPPPEITWRRRERPMPDGEEELTAASLTFPTTTRHHTGVYTCSADNGWGRPATATIRLDVQHKPEIEQEETFIHTKDGDEVEITCTVHASPPAAVEWYRNGQLLDNNKTIIQKRGNRHSLMLQQVGKLDTFGKYQCRATNSLGEDMALTEVSGKAAPAAFKSPAEGREQDRYTLEWVVTSTSTVTEFRVEWREEGADAWESEVTKVEQVEKESYAGQVALTNLKTGLYYVARVSATNTYGLSSPSNEFKVTSHLSIHIPSILPSFNPSINSTILPSIQPPIHPHIPPSSKFNFNLSPPVFHPEGEN